MAGGDRVSLALYTVCRAAVVGFCRLWNRVRVSGLEHVPPTGAYILAPVHRSNMDTPYAAFATRRRLRFMGKDSLWRNPVVAWLFSALGGFPVARGTADREALKRCADVLAGGEPLVVFAEGERKSGPLVAPLFEGAAYLALRARVPIVPVGIGGSERVMPKGARFIRPCRVAVVIGPPLVPAVADGARVARAAVKQLTDRLHGELQELFDAAQTRAGA
jgi:1-acyl-sn-glycerol-3-phosphate acyltransferase